MRILAALLVVTAIAALLAWELLWRFDHPLPNDAVTSPQGEFVAQTRTLPEGSELPYGHGVFVRHRYLPLWAASNLVFAAYCKPDVSLAWPAAQQLSVGCAIFERTAIRFPPPAGITVVHDGGA